MMETSFSDKKKFIKPEIIARIVTAQRNEVTEHFIYRRLAGVTKNQHNREVLERISDEELSHYRLWRDYSGEKVKPDWFKVIWYYLVARVFGLTFGIKLMESGEKSAGVNYKEIAETVPEAMEISREEDGHEKELLSLIDEEWLKYVGSMVLGLSDALVELTGALAGLTLALQNGRLVAVTGLITGIAASFSMSASEYLPTRSEATERDPFKAAIYTGLTYIATVAFLILPFLILSNVLKALAFTILNAVIVILIFTFYVSVTKEMPFKSRFLEMTGVSFGVAALSFGIGFLVRALFKINI